MGSPFFDANIIAIDFMFRYQNINWLVHTTFYMIRESRKKENNTTKSKKRKRDIYRACQLW